MKRPITLVITAAALAAAGAALYLSRTDETAAAWATVETVFADCHNDVDLAGEKG